jgi:molybdopterin-guanine dinucleotide biosynthesis protein A
MGTDKATLIHDGVALAQRGIDALLGAGIERVVVVGGSHDFGVELIPDRDPGAGPLGAVVTALAAVAPSDVVILPCDLPGIDAATVNTLLASAAASQAVPVVVGTVGGRPAWPIGVWRQSAAEPLRAAWAAGERSLNRAASPLSIGPVELGARAADADEPGDLRHTDTLAPGGRHDPGGAE